MRKNIKFLFLGVLLLVARFTVTAVPSATPLAYAADLTPLVTCHHPIAPRGASGPEVKLVQQLLNWFYNHTSFKDLPLITLRYF